jgi:hypothetical protein
VTGEAPQPGETPRKESNPWTFSDPETAFWRGDADHEPEGAVAAESARRPHRSPATQAATLPPPTFSETEKQYTGEAAGALAAGRQDATSVLAEPAESRKTRKKPDQTQPDQTQPDQAQPDQAQPDQAKVDRDHLQLDAARFDPSSYATTTPESAAQSADPPTRSKRAPGVPEGSALVETENERPTAAEEHPPAPKESTREAIPAKTPAAVPPQPTTGLSRLSQAAQRPPSPLLETSTFWLTDEQRAERAATMPVDEVREKLNRPGRRRPSSTRRPATGLIALVALGLVAAFFAWVSAEPFWLAVGHGDAGVATVAQCTGDGVTQRCTGRFQTTDGQYARTTVALLGVAPGQRNPGAISPARMVNRTSHHAYVGETGLLTQLRWLLGFALVLLCGFGIAALTGARRLETAKARRSALIMSLTGPLVLLAGFLYVAF